MGGQKVTESIQSHSEQAHAQARARSGGWNWSVTLGPLYVASPNTGREMTWICAVQETSVIITTWTLLWIVFYPASGFPEPLPCLMQGWVRSGIGNILG